MTNNVRPPKRLKKRPQWRGLPIPYIAMIRDDGTPDFRVTDEQKRRSVMANAWCQLCGEPLGKFKFFVGGTEAAKANAFFEPACHLDCLIYAMQVCPFIAGKMEHAELEKVQQRNPDWNVRVDDTFTKVKNPYWVIVKADGWSYAKTPDGTILLVPWKIKATKPLLAEKMSGPEWTQVMKELAK